jgi:hypothetical protein
MEQTIVCILKSTKPKRQHSPPHEAFPPPTTARFFPSPIHLFDWQTSSFGGLNPPRHQHLPPPPGLEPACTESFSGSLDNWL